MNGEQQRKALNYALTFLRDEILSIKETLETAKDPLTTPHLKQRLKELEADYEVFKNIHEEVFGV